MLPTGRPSIIAALLALAASIPCHARVTPASWNVVETRERPDAEPTLILTTTSIDTALSPSGEPSSALLQIRCSGTQTSATLSSDATFTVKSDSDVTLPIRLDGAQAVAAGWANLSPRRILIYNLRDLLGTHRSLTIGLPIGAHGLQSLTFDLSGLASTMHDHNCRRHLE